MSETVFNKNYLIKNTSITSLCRGIGVASGMILDAMILAYFGLSKETDAFFVALAIPFVIISVLEIETPKVLVPVFTDRFKNEGKEKTYDLIRNLITTSATLLLLLSLLGMMLAGILMPLQVPGLQTDVIRLSTSLSMFLFWLILIRGIGFLFQSLLYVYHQYLVLSSTKFVSNSVAILTVILFHEQFGIYALAFGFLLGGITQLIIMIFAIASEGFRYRFVCRFNDPSLHRILRLLFYPFTGHTLSSSKVLLENFLASFMTGGSISAVRYATKIVSAFAGFLLSSVTTTTLPLASHYAATKNLEEMKRTILKGIKLLTLIALPLCIWLIFTCEPLLILLFERGEFTRANTTLTSILIVLMTPYILFSRILSITQIPFYATMDMRTPLFSTIVFFLIYSASALLLTMKIGVYAFPVASSFASLSAAIAMSTILHRKFGPLGWKKLDGFGLRLCGALVITSFAFMIGLGINNNFPSQSFTNKLLLFIIPTFLGTGSFLTASILLRVISWDSFYGLIGRSKTSPA